MNFTTQRRVSKRHRNKTLLFFCFGKKERNALTIPSFRIVSFLEEEISTQGIHTNGRFYTSTRCNDYKVQLIINCVITN